MILGADGSVLRRLSTSFAARQHVLLETVTVDGRIVVAHATNTDRNSSANWDWRFGFLSSNGDPLADVDLGVRMRMPANLQSFAIDRPSRVIVTGYFNQVDGSATGKVIRLNSDGTLDRTFNPALEAPGEILLVGDDNAALIANFEPVTSNGQATYVVHRVLASGAIGTGFVPPANIQTWHSMTSDHRVLASRFVPDVQHEENLQLVWLGVDGSAQVLPTRFGGFTNSLGSIDSDPIAFARPISGGHILVGGSFRTVNGVPRPFLAALNADGSVDPAFAPDIPTGLANVIVDPPDRRQRVVITTIPIGNESRFSFRILPDGTRDPTFLNIPGWPAAAQFRLENGLPDLTFPPPTTAAQKVSPALAVVTPDYVRALEAPDGSRWTLSPLVRFVRQPGVTIVAGPAGQIATVGDAAVFYGSADIDGAATYQWCHDGQPVPGASQAVLTIAQVTPADAGHYTVRVLGDDATATSAPVLLTVAGGAGRLMNVSTLVRITPTQQPTIGFTVANDGAPRQWLVRAIGDGLWPFGIADPLPEPMLWLGGSNGTIAADRGGAATGLPANLARRVGAFPARASWSPILLPNAPTSDSGVVALLNAGAYSAVATPASGGSGRALLEVYDSFVGGASGGLRNASVRGTINSDNETLTLGFVIDGGTPVKILARAVGPALRAFGIATPLNRPVFTQFSARSSGTGEGAGSSDPAAIAEAAKRVGAFPADSTNPGLILELSAGAYTVTLGSADGSSGEALLELYTIAP